MPCGIANPSIGDKVYVIGAGIVGLLMACTVKNIWYRGDCNR